MKILQVIQFFAPQFGGTVTSVYNLSERLSRQGHEVTILTTDWGLNEEYLRSIELKGVNVISLHCKFNLFSFLYSPSIKKWLRENIKDFDVIHMHNFRTYQNYIVSNYAKKAKIPYILQARGSVLPFFQKKVLKRVYDWIIGYKLLNNAKLVLALTKNESNQYKKMGIPSNKIKIIPNGIDPSKFNDLISKGQFKVKHNINDNEDIILYLGRLHKIKGIDLLLKAFELLSKNMDNVKLVIVGPGDVSTFKKMSHNLSIENKVIFTGPLYGNDKYEAFIDSDLYILPSVYEAFPNTILEAFLFGKPVVVTDGCGIKDIIHKNAGYVVKYDKNSLKDAMYSILINKKLKSSFGENGRHIVNNEFNWTKIIDKLENLYECLSCSGGS